MVLSVLFSALQGMKAMIVDYSTSGSCTDVFYDGSNFILGNVPDRFSNLKWHAKMWRGWCRHHRSREIISRDWVNLIFKNKQARILFYFPHGSDIDSGEYSRSVESHNENA
jgi:hypothetical protein